MRALPVVLSILGLGCAAGRSTTIAGSSLPPNHKLYDLQGKPVELARLVADKDATVLVFWASVCPCVKRYDGRVAALPAHYPKEKVQVVAVSSNADDDMEGLRKEAAERKLTVPLLVDLDGTLATALKVRSTPSVVVLDRAGSLKFKGWIDNERLPGEPDREPYLERALDGLLAGRSDFSSTSPTYGCQITKSVDFAARTLAPPPDPHAEHRAPAPSN
ncbi:MAG: redoxin family protein [Myxococcales bacterium]|nr:redoxin family protein [Myxococcales bacterium]